MIQKLNYIHNNPVSGKWKLAPSSDDCMHSLALFYLNGTQRTFAVADYAELLDWGNMYEDTPLPDVPPTVPGSTIHFSYRSVSHRPDYVSKYSDRWGICTN